MISVSNPGDVAAGWSPLSDIDDKLTSETLDECKRRAAAAIKILIGDYHSDVNDQVASVAVTITRRMVLSICGTAGYQRDMEMGATIILASLLPDDDGLNIEAIVGARAAAIEEHLAEMASRASGKHPRA